ncbi:peroxisomal membrane anchor protein conserved region-domain-containing protein [Delphinella strobiligena]|nr:peroxisomal membrane anchor protein conserved region-domain-containing protein [Delphinella strobiligena]
MSNADKSKHQAAIPAWQRKQEPLSRNDGSDTAAKPESDASTRSTDGSNVAAKQEFDATNELPDSLREPTGRLANTPNTDGSQVAAKQEFEASKETPDSPRFSSGHLASTPNTHGSQVAAKQEFDASNALPHNLREPDSPVVNTPRTDGSDIAASQEFEASKTVIDQVRKFLQDPNVKDAPMQKKLSFLESKGVQRDVIQDVLSSETTSATFSTADFQTSRQVQEPNQVHNHVPPIVTYPEFLMQPQNPPPIVTVKRLLSTAYITGGLVATIYALSNFIISPMAANLAEARHELAEHSSDKLSLINDKLSSLVSAVPLYTKTKTGTADSDDIDDNESTVSDPTELFHRDIGTQTSAPPSPATESPDPDNSLAAPESVLSKQQTCLKIMHSHMSELLDANESNASTNEDIQTGTSDFKQYLDRLAYSIPAYQYHPGDSVFTPPGTPKDKKDDAVAAFKAEIRGVKGVLLSAKRFPSAAVR